MKRALVCGAGGFIAGHLVKALRAEGYWVRGVDIKRHEFAPSAANEFLLLDLRDEMQAKEALALPTAVGEPFDEVYQLAADMGGMGFIHSAECEIMRNSALVNLNVIHAAALAAVPRYFLSSSVCVYRDMSIGEPELSEQQAYPAFPDNEYGWEKLYAERVASAYGRRNGITVRIARFQNCYGPEGTWAGGREKAPAAICRKVAEIEGEEGTIEVWGDGTAVRSYIYVADMVEAIVNLMQSDLDGPVNIGTSEYVAVADLVRTVGDIAGKNIQSKYVPGPVGVQSRNFSHERMLSTGWEPHHSLRQGLEKTYPWIEQQVKATRSNMASNLR